MLMLVQALDNKASGHKQDYAPQKKEKKKVALSMGNCWKPLYLHVHVSIYTRNINKNLVKVDQMGIKNGSWLVNLLVTSGY